MNTRGIIKWRWLMCCGAGVGLLAAATGHAATLHVTVEKVRNDSQPVRVLLFNTPDTFPDEERYFRVQTTKANEGTAVVEFTDLPPGAYAIMAYHDENEDNRLNRVLGMWPSEGYGLSLNPLVMGPPTFQETSFELSPQGLSVTLSLQY
ncbi:MAG: DUF2141 domain-containing protein [Nitrospira sp. SB0662_bin_26]|nr:DUF2141 domain-containing protein [Nitrospira sp. SB0662_bin_26]